MICFSFTISFVLPLSTKFDESIAKKEPLGKRAFIR